LEDAAARQAGLRPGPYVVVAVSDTGRGMDARTRSRLFEPFFTTKQEGQGSGLGLSMVYGAVKQAEGHITVYSQVQCGTLFEIYLPRVKETKVVRGEQHRAVTKGSEAILLVDDEEGVRKLCRAILENAGYTVIEAANGQAALTAYEKNAHKIDLVLTDVVMPQMTGYELGEQLMLQNRGLPMLFMSGYREGTANPALAQQSKPLLKKPFSPDQLLGMVREVLDTRAA